jgi:hypothetical protein
MKTTKMSLANIQGKLSRVEMKNIMAGSGSSGCTVKCGNPGDSCVTDTGSNGTCRFVIDFLCCIPIS